MNCATDRYVYLCMAFYNDFLLKLSTKIVSLCRYNDSSKQDLFNKKRLSCCCCFRLSYIIWTASMCRENEQMNENMENSGLHQFWNI